MASSFLPLQLIHAHLPAPPSIPHAIPEIRASKDLEYPKDSSIYAEPLHPDHAVSSIREPSSGILARSIRNGYALELRTLNTLVAKNRSRDTEGSEIIRVVFPNRLLPLTEGCISISRSENKLFIIVVTESTVVYRLNFPLGSFMAGRADRFVFSTDNKDWCEEFIVPKVVTDVLAGVGTWIALNEDTVVLGCGDGGIARLDRALKEDSADSVIWTASHFRGSNKFRLPSLFSRSQPDEQVISFARHTSGPSSLLYALSRDRRLRTWHAETGTCLRSVDIRPSSSTEMVQYTESTPPRSTSSSSSSQVDGVAHVKVIRHPSSTSRYSHLVVAFYPTPSSPGSAGSFVVYRGSDSASGANDLVYAGARPCSSLSAGSEMRGFEVIQPYSKEGVSTGWRLQVAWDSKTGLSVETVTMDDIFQFTTYLDHPSSFLLTDWNQASRPDELNQYDAAYFDSLLGRDAPNPSIPNDNSDITVTFIDHLFYPGRFSSLTLSTALEEYIQVLPRQDTYHLVISANGAPTLQQRFSSIVGCHLQIQADPQTGAPVIEAYRRDIKLDWLGIWARVRDLDKQGRWAINTTIVNDQVLILTREGVSSTSILDVTGVIAKYSSTPETAADLRALPNDSIRHLYPSLTTPKARSGAMALFAAGSFVASILSNASVDEGAINALEDVYVASRTMFARGIQEPIESLAGHMWDEAIEPFISDEDHNHVRRILSECLDVRRAISEAISILSTTIPLPSGTPNNDQAFSGFGNAFITSSLALTISNRFIASQNVLFVALFHLAETPDITSEDEDAEEFLQVLHKAFVLFHRYSVLKWLVAQTAEESVEFTKARKTKRKAGNGDDKLSDSLGGLNMGEYEGGLDGFDATYSVIHVLLDNQRRQNPTFDSLDIIGVAAEHFISSSQIFHHDVSEIDPSIHDVKLGYSILTAGLPLLAGGFADLYPLSAGMAYIRGRASMQAGFIGEAVKSFEQAAVGCKNGSISQIIPSCTGPTGLSAFYQHVSLLFAEYGQNGPVVHFGHLALLSLPKDAPSQRSIWTTVFLAHIGMGQYEDAYALLMKIPFLDLQRDFLGQLISVMCEANEIGRLNQLGFIGMQKEVEGLLSYKAKNSDPLRNPNYYKVLYSWYISRGDYRSAGDTMYQQGKRFGESSTTKISAGELATMQARSYLAAVNALKLIDRRNAWISIPGPPAKTLRGSKRKRISSFIPEEEFSKDKRPINIITLEDIELEYALVLSKLKLAGQVPDILEHGVSMSPDEIVGMLVERNMFDVALSAASTMDVDMTNIFVSIAKKCVELSRISDHRGESPSAVWLHASPITANLRGSPAALAQRYLQTTLSQHDSTKTHFNYRRAVSHTFFEMNVDKSTGWQMPAWLVEWEMERDPESWISSALRFGWVEESVDWSSELLRRAVPPELLSKKPDTAILPYNLFDRVLAAAGEGDEKEDKTVQVKVKALREAIKRRIEGLQKLEGR